MISICLSLLPFYFSSFAVEQSLFYHFPKIYVTIKLDSSKDSQKDLIRSKPLKFKARILNLSGKHLVDPGDWPFDTKVPQFPAALFLCIPTRYFADVVPPEGGPTEQAVLSNASNALDVITNRNGWKRIQDNQKQPPWEWNTCAHLEAKDLGSALHLIWSKAHHGAIISLIVCH